MLIFDRLAQGDPALVGSLLQAGHTAGLPLAFHSDAALSRHIQDWVAAHPSEGLPGSRPFFRQSINNQHHYSKPIYFSTTSELVNLERFKLSETRMGCVIKDENGSCMLMKSAFGNCGAKRGYQGWLGGDKGFSHLTIADNYNINESPKLRDEVAM